MCAAVAVCPAGVNVARMLIDQGDLVLIADNQGIRDIYSADGNSIDKSTPLVVLVNKGTASASEVGACCVGWSKHCACMLWLLRGSEGSCGLKGWLEE